LRRDVSRDARCRWWKRSRHEGDDHDCGSREPDPCSKPDPIPPRRAYHLTCRNILAATFGALDEVRDDGLALRRIQPALEVRRELVDAQMQSVLRVM
jgi:hypothetical protein